MLDDATLAQQPVCLCVMCSRVQGHSFFGTPLSVGWSSLSGVPKVNVELYPVLESVKAGPEGRCYARRRHFSTTVSLLDACSQSAPRSHHVL